MHVLDDPKISSRLSRFLTSRARRTACTDENVIRSTASIQGDHGQRRAPEELVTAMVRFEQRYGGLTYPLIVGNGMDYGLDGETTAHHSEFGLAFEGIVDGDWTWPVDVLVDGRTAMAPGAWRYRIIDTSVDQRLEKHALLADVRDWPHRTVEYATSPDVLPAIDSEGLPPPVPSASGPADLWWADDGTAVQLTLHGWWPDRDEWLVRYFATTPDQLSQADRLLDAAIQQPTTPATWCDLCSTRLNPDRAFIPPNP